MKMKWKTEPCPRCSGYPSLTPKCKMCSGRGVISRPVFSSNTAPKKAVWWSRW